MIRYFILLALSTTLLHAQAEDRWIDSRPPESKTFKARQTRTLASFADVKPLDDSALTRYGGLAADKQRATGFFRIEKLGERWWMIDPEGGRFIFTGVCSLRGPSITKSGIAPALNVLRSADFRGVGGFSDHAAIHAAEKPLPYTVTLNLMSQFGKKLGLTHAESGHTGYADDCIPVFDPGFEAHCAEICREQLATLKDDPWLVGVFSDNELPTPEDLLDRMLKRPGAPQAAAKAFLREKTEITDELRRAFIEHVFDAYFRITTKAIRRALPQHLCLGSRFHGRALRLQGVWTAAGRWCDAVSVNYYNRWTPDKEHLTHWHTWSGKPCLVTEFYVKAVDSGLPNTTGAGWLVKTQADRGAFYQNFALALLESKSCVGWHWFKYIDNDPTDKNAEASNKDSNKGILNLRGEPYQPLLDAMRELNSRVFPLIERMDRRLRKPRLAMPHQILTRRRFIANSMAAASLSAVVSAADNDTPDICIYGGTASGVMAAVTAAKQGRSVVLIEPSRWLGGMTGGGLSHVDWGREKAVGGTALSILSKNYDDAQYRQVFRELVKKYRIRVIDEHRVSALQKDGAAIRSLTLDHAPPDALGCPVAAATKANAMTIAAQVFIDCSYEGDLMARAGVSYTWGRESCDEYGESLAGVRPNLAVYAIDPYVTPGDAKSGLLPFIQDMKAQPEGSAYRLTMGYGFRWKFSKDADRIPIDPPEQYDPKQWELYRRGFKNKAGIDVGRRMKGKLGFFEEAGGRIHSMGAGNLARALLAPTNYGGNAAYPDGDYATRARIWKADQEFMRGMTHFLRTDDCVPDKFKQTALEFGFQRGIFDDTHGWPHQLYVREARRMKSDYVLTQKDLEGSTDPADSIGLASYGVDDWPYATYVHEGKVALYGGEFSMLYLDEKHEGIYKIPYRAITPKPTECTNLLVPVCVSASHIAMTSIRMEPVWMILGESAGVAAAMAVAENLPVQQVSYAAMKEKLLALKQKLERPV